MSLVKVSAEAKDNMAMIFTGKSTCSICKAVLEEGQKILGWPSFLSSDHPLWEYSDSGMHEACFHAWEFKEEFEHLYNYQPLVDFESPHLQKAIKEQGIPKWLQKIKAYRELNKDRS